MADSSMMITLHERGVRQNIASLVSILWENLGKLIVIALLFTLPGLIPDILSQMDPSRGFRRTVVASVLIIGVLVAVPAATTYNLMNLAAHFDTPVGLDALAITNLLLRWSSMSFLSILYATVSVMF